MSIRALPVPKLARIAGAQTARRLPNWFRIAAVATTRLEPMGSFDPVPSGIRFEDGKPLWARSPHTRASHATNAAGLAWKLATVPFVFLIYYVCNTEGLVVLFPPLGRRIHTLALPWFARLPADQVVEFLE